MCMNIEYSLQIVYYISKLDRTYRLSQDYHYKYTSNQGIEVGDQLNTSLPVLTVSIWHW